MKAKAGVESGPVGVKIKVVFDQSVVITWKLHSTFYNNDLFYICIPSP